MNWGIEGVAFRISSVRYLLSSNGCSALGWLGCLLLTAARLTLSSCLIGACLVALAPLLGWLRCLPLVFIVVGLVQWLVGARVGVEAV